VTLVVLDASVAVAWALPSQSTRAADDLAKRRLELRLAAPGIFWHEVRNALLAFERRGRIAPSVVDAELSTLEKSVTLIDDGAPEDIFALARAERLSIYDACYLDLALRAGAELASRDTALLAAGGRRGARLYDAR